MPRCFRRSCLRSPLKIRSLRCPFCHAVNDCALDIRKSSESPICAQCRRCFLVLMRRRWWGGVDVTVRVR